ncbi:MAG: hypothetical protein AAF827_01035 [Cyanobacteria bacterium P01_D01_bin.6]
MVIPISGPEGDLRLQPVNKSKIELEVQETRALDLATQRNIKITVTVPEALVSQYRGRAEELTISLSESVTQALRLSNFIQSTLEDGGALYIEDKHGEVMKLEISQSK